MESRLLRKNGGFQQATAIIVDTTGRKRAQDVERRLAAIIASYNEANFGINLGMKITRWNTGAERRYDRQGEKPAILRQVSAGLEVEP